MLTVELRGEKKFSLKRQNKKGANGFVGGRSRFHGIRTAQAAWSKQFLSSRNSALRELP